jgi:aminopeptidase N
MRPIVFERWRYPNDNFDAHTYPKGAVILNMLRWVMGDASFRRTLSHFLHEYAFQPVDTHDFIKAAKEATGQNIEWFIEQWIFRPGHPVFDVSYDWEEDREKILLTIRQTQDTSGDIPIYRTPIVIGVHTAEGKTSNRIWLERKEEVVELSSEQKPLLVRFDEGNYLLKEWTFEKSTDELLYQIDNDDVIGRMWAASELAKHGSDPRTVPALVTAAKGDSFWAVRRSAVETIGKLDGKTQTALLKEAALDPSSKVRVAALEALGNTGDEGLLRFLEERFERDDSYLAQAEALRSLGKTADGTARAFIEEAKGMSSPRDVVERAATWALEQIEK